MPKITFKEDIFKSELIRVDVNIRKMQHEQFLDSSRCKKCYQTMKSLIGYMNFEQLMKCIVILLRDESFDDYFFDEKEHLYDFNYYKNFVKGLFEKNIKNLEIEEAKVKVAIKAEDEINILKSLESIEGNITTQYLRDVSFHQGMIVIDDLNEAESNELLHDFLEVTPSARITFKAALANMD
jgi:hypothetical protein